MATPNEWKEKFRRTFFFCLSAFFFAGIVCESASADEWQDLLESRFDIVETFNDIGEWYGKEYDPDAASGGVFFDTFPDDFPKKNDGTSSMWCYYSKWAKADTIAEKNWIGNFGQGTHIGNSGNSAVIDLSGKEAPSRLGTYFGDGSPNSGYKDIYVFYMTKIYANQWPTKCVKDGTDVQCLGGGPTGVYEAGKSYAYWAVWKFNNIGLGWNTCKEWNGGVPIHEQRYGYSEIIPLIRINNYGPIPRLDGMPEQKQNLILTASVNTYENGPIQKLENVKGEDINIIDLRETAVKWEGKGAAAITDEWMGVEFHFTLEEPAGAGNGKMEAWIYNKNGDSLRSFYIEGINYLPASADGQRFNRFFFGGNNSNSYAWGPTMDAPYYVDDFVVDDNRIGPTYFSLTQGTPVADKPQAPKGLTIKSVE